MRLDSKYDEGKADLWDDYYYYVQQRVQNSRCRWYNNPSYGKVFIVLERWQVSAAIAVVFKGEREEAAEDVILKKQSTGMCVTRNDVSFVTR